MNRRIPIQFVALFLAIVMVGSAAGATEMAKHRRALADALAQNYQRAITTAVTSIHDRFGRQQGIPEVVDQYTQIPFAAAPLTKAESLISIGKVATQIERRRWWRVGLDPTQLSRPLRDPASAMMGLLAFSRVERELAATSVANEKGGKHTAASPEQTYLNAAREAGDFLLWAQSQAGSGVFPFPAFRGSTNHAAFGAVEGRLSRIERKGLSGHVKNGWIIEDEDSGGLQFDNGECGVAMFALYEATHDKKYLDSAVRAAEWAARRPLVANWNYNSFSVRLLARAYLVTGNVVFLESATQKALLGVIPGQLKAGERKGRWGDPHNARPTYHYIMMDRLVELVAALRKARLDNGSAFESVVNTLRLGLIARNKDFLAINKGAPTKETAMIALLNVNRVFAGDAQFLKATQTREALDALTKLVSAQYRHGIVPLAPGAWGVFVETLVVR